jgi:hypothetical protein
MSTLSVCPLIISSIGFLYFKCDIFNGQIDSNLEVCISNFHVYGTVTLAVTVTVNSGASHLHGNHLASAVRRNQRPTTSQTVSSS